MKFKRVDQVVAWRLCMGCGACALVCPEEAIELADVHDEGIRPFVAAERCGHCSKCVDVCPGIEVCHKSSNSGTIAQLRRGWGPVLALWEGYAADPEIRYKGSSGGAATALSLYGIEHEDIGGVLHIRADSKDPLRNIEVVSKNREELLAGVGSRYSPGAPCIGLAAMTNSDSRCVFVGKPCDVAALRKLQGCEPRLTGKVRLAISIFCAGTPSTSGTEELIRQMGVSKEEVVELRYRGHGWPGNAAVTTKSDCRGMRQMSYERSWGGILSKHVPLRCRLCPDGTGELADISCGDPWYREADPAEPGRSLLVVRTETGKRFLQDAMRAGYILLQQVESRALTNSQESLWAKRASLWGRLTAMRVGRVPVPHYRGFYLFANWLRLPFMAKARSVLGTCRRILLRGWNSPAKVTTASAKAGETRCTVLRGARSQQGGYQCKA